MLCLNVTDLHFPLTYYAYSQMPNKRPGTLINFCDFFSTPSPIGAYEDPPLINFSSSGTIIKWSKFQDIWILLISVMFGVRLSLFLFGLQHGQQESRVWNSINLSISLPKLFSNLNLFINHRVFNLRTSLVHRMRQIVNGVKEIQPPPSLFRPPPIY